ncbi:AAA family ATPase [uncultured Clostridium sp.]|uniref:AAA family ATPase n=1 Tax=uncultured Clostridium sp. TaxID=59620 RepID=UPI00261A1CD8|nr:AAA family ATPase [uncultured Clostridium sp.]
MKEKKPQLIVMCGLQSSGKSYQAKVLKLELEKGDNKQKTVILSSDEIRKENPGLANDKIFSKLYSDMNYWLRHGDNVIIDATNITIKSRKHIFTSLQVDCYKICYIMNTLVATCIERVKERNKDSNEHFVPLEVIDKYHKSFEIPFYEEGWDEIKLHNIPEANKTESMMNMLLCMADGFDQCNKHHTQDLLQHMLNTESAYADLITKCDVRHIVRIAAKYHDVGKLFTQTFGEDGQAHYYNHANIGAYYLMCIIAMYYGIYSAVEYDPESTLEFLFYINYHMHMYNLKTEKSVNKWKNIFGEFKFNQLKLLNECDMNSHINNKGGN